MTGQDRTGQDRTKTRPGRRRGRDCFSSTHTSTHARWRSRLRCGRGCELFLNRIRKQGVCLSLYLVSPFRDGHSTVWDCTQVPLCGNGGTYRRPCMDLRSAGHGSGLACVPVSLCTAIFHVPADDAQSPSQTTEEWEKEGARYREWGLGIWGEGGMEQRRGSPGHFSRYLGTAGNDDPPGPRQKMWIGNGSSRPFTVVTRPSFTCSGHQDPSALSVLSGPLGPRGPFQPLARFNQLPGPNRLHCHDQSHRTSQHIIHTTGAACIMIGHARTTHNKHARHALHDGNGFSHSLHLGSNRTGEKETISTPALRHAAAHLDADHHRVRLH
jgi:hypothetical protein